MDRVIPQGSPVTLVKEDTMKPYSIDRYAHLTCRYGCCKNPKGSKKHLATRRRQKRSV